ncbi:PREDICTED: uncharacterized protein LOC104776889 isoform X4 [Camelina sativa]|uniref:Uncharacterized protein LOC104776889 isoform X4 n=1 Tax=Camelina sativa TaxID=90675 RepID=A0ABM0YDJ0_CAMSA|nr:PREDICTED: uncharacterized protein LOC104776889 isoform X4 [Camelina sativa]
MGFRMCLLLEEILLMDKINSFRLKEVLLVLWIWSIIFGAKAHPDVIEANGLATPESYQSDLAYLKKKTKVHAFGTFERDREGYMHLGL